MQQTNATATITPAEEEATEKKAITVTALTLDLYLDYVKPAALTAGLLEAVTAYDQTLREYTAYHTSAAIADEITHCMYCACICSDARHDHAAQMLHQLDVSIQYRSETAAAMTALRHELSKMIADPDTDTEKEVNPMTEIITACARLLPDTAAGRESAWRALDYDIREGVLAFWEAHFDYDDPDFWASYDPDLDPAFVYAVRLYDAMERDTEEK